MNIVINIDDWKEETMRAEETPKNVEDLANLAMEQGYLSPQLFRMYAYLREAGIADADALPDNKSLFQKGGTQSLCSKFAIFEKTIEIKGKEYRARAMVAPLSRTIDDEGDVEEIEDDDDAPTTWQACGTPEAADLAWRYLERDVAARIWGRFLVLADSGGDVRAAADMLHDKIDEMVEKVGEE